jgi:predicted enzyme involved in methoxymalonyl-ACP biosynthesis
LYLIEHNDSIARIDSFVLSCRALGRGIETCIMNTIKQEFLLGNKCTVLHGIFRQTAKNMPASTFFADQGFVPTTGDSKEQHYELSTQSAHLSDCPGITLQ